MAAARISMVARAFVLLVAACSGGTSTTTAPTSEDLTVASTERPLATTTTTAPSTTTALSTTTAPPTSTDAPGPELEIWSGDVAEQIIELQFTVDDAGTITGTVSSPLDDAPAVPLDGSVDGRSFTIRIPVVAVVFEGEFSGDTMTGTWFQSGIELPVTLQRREEPLVFERPQEPVPPFPYESTDVRFDNGDVSLAGTLVVPAGDGPFPAVVLVSGSGPQDRDETLLGHRPFLVLADAFARRGIASLRYDDRGVGGSTGSPFGATTADLATDAAAAVAYLDAAPRTGPVGIVGHSEGGIIGPMVAGESEAVEFVVLLAGPGLPGRDVLLRQNEDLLRAEGASEADIAWQLDWRSQIMNVSASDLPADEAAREIEAVASAALANPPDDVTDPLAPTLAGVFVEAFSDPWMRFFLTYDPAPALVALDIPVLALIGSLDLQVSAEENIPALDDALAANPAATVLELEGLNHLFQTATTGAVAEYARIDETFAPSAIDIVTTWILEQS
jgi:pimeloyl-ACP methyl ester carboxylesterase